jgi:hypothetical protein
VLTNLPSKASQACLVGVGWKAGRQLLPKLVGEASFDLENLGVVDELITERDGKSALKLDVWGLVHSHEKATSVAVLTVPLINPLIYLFPTTEIEIADAKVGAVGML